MSNDAPTSPRPEDDATDPVTSTLAAAALEFPRIELPPAPNFGLPSRMDETTLAADAAVDGLPPVMTPNVDEPATTEWRSPFPVPEPENRYAFQISAPVDAPLPAPANSPWQPQPQQQAATTPVVQPAPPAPALPADRAATTSIPMPTPAPVEADEVVIEPTGMSRVLVLAWSALAVFLFWASGYAFSAALMGLAALVAAELAAALALAGGRSQPAGSTARAVAAAAALFAILAARKGFAGFSPDAFVGGIFVILAVVPCLVVLGVTALVLRRRGAELTAAEHAFSRGRALRVLALLATAAAGYRAHTAWTASLDAIVALAVTALAVITLVPVLVRGTAPARLSGD